MKTLHAVFACFALLFFAGCPSPIEPVAPFILVDLVDQQGLVAPTADTLQFTTSAIVDGSLLTKDFGVEAPDHALPTSFVVRFSESVRGTIVDIRIHGFLNGVEVYTATTSGVAGTATVEAVARFCGDGTADDDRAEGCDDGPLNDDNTPNACRTDCQPAGCGDGVLDAGEDCDDGANNSDTIPDACRTTCLFSFCGDGVLDAGELCDDGSNNSDVAADACRTSCQLPRCGDGAVDTGEDCDDANTNNGDGCDNDCAFIAVIQLAVGGAHSCALFRTGDIRCWGGNGSGQLGQGNTLAIGDDEAPSSVGLVDVGGKAVQVVVGSVHTCALLDTGKVRCWGAGNLAQLGYGNLNNIGDDETPASAGDVNVGGTVVQLSAGVSHTCALLSTGRVRCWGFGFLGELGYGIPFAVIGDNETPASAGDLNLGTTIAEVISGSNSKHNCARFVNGKLRCWGDNPSGQLGYGNVNRIGDDEVPSSAGDVSVGFDVIQVATAFTHTCALSNLGLIRCWGSGANGRLGYGNTTSIGDDELPSSVGTVNVGGPTVQLRAGDSHSCALLDTGSVVCWGDGTAGQLGYGNTVSIGDNELPSTAGPINIGGNVVELSVGSSHSCVLLDTGHVRCWGFGGAGRLGYGNTENIGDDEDPASAGDIDLF